MRNLYTPTDEDVAVLKKKLTLLGEATRVSHAEHTLVLAIVKAVDEGVLRQVSELDKPFNKPSGRAYTGRAAGSTNGYCNTYWYSTYDGCRDWWVYNNVLHLEIWDGTFLDAERTSRRGRWSFEMSPAAYHVPVVYDELSKVVTRDWRALLVKTFEDQEHERRTREIAAIEARLLNSI